MFFVIFFLSAGMLLGFVLRKKKRIIKMADITSMWAIYLLMFFLGVSVGINEVVLSSFGRLGVQAFILSWGAVFGSVLVSFFVDRRFFGAQEK